jgi:hypothetical protein
MDPFLRILSSREFSKNTGKHKHEPTIQTGGKFQNVSNREAQINDCDSINSGESIDSGERIDSEDNTDTKDLS